VKELFRLKLHEIERSDPDHLSTNLDENAAHRFVATIYVDGSNKSQCKVWRTNGNGFMGRGIFYAGNGIVTMMGDDSYNEALSLQDTGHELFFKASGMRYFGADETENLSPEAAAEYIWKLFEQNFD